jgi:WD40 repeat protein
MLPIGLKRLRMTAPTHAKVFRSSRVAIIALVLLCSIAPAARVRADGGPLNRAKPEPILRVQASGPTSEIFQLEFSPDGKTLYAVGRDKVVHVWTLKDATGESKPRFQYRPDLVRRVPIAPGRWGNLDALAVSPDGRWVATGGYGAVTSLVADYRMPGFLYSSDVDILTPEQSEEQGLIYLFDAAQTDRHTVLRGHRGPIAALIFVNVAGKLRLVSAATEDSKNPHLVFRVWDAESGRMLQVIDPPPPASSFSKNAPHEIEAWSVDGQLRAAFCVWDHNLPEGTQRLRILNLTNGKEEPFERPVFAWCCRLAPSRENSEPLFVGTHATTKRPPRFAGWSKAGLATFWEAPVGHSITYLRPIDDRRVALVLLNNQTRVYELIIRDVKSTAGKAVASIPLGRWPNPRVAISKAGYLAVGGNSRNEIEIHPLPNQEGPADRQKPLQRLDGSGQIFSVATFVRKDGNTGLRLGKLEEHSGVQLVMNLSTSRLEKDAAGWTDWAPDLSSLHLDGALQDRRRLEFVRDGQRAIWDLATLTSEASITAQALCPDPQVEGLRGIPLRAVAIDRNNGDSELNIYYARTGKRLRRCEGHTAAIISLAFSQDGRLLASCGKDRTVNLWWLADLPETIAKLGALPDVRLRQVDDKSFIVASAPANSGLREGEAILGLVEPQPGGSRIQKFDSVGDFLRGVAEHKPGERIEIVQANHRTTVTVGQAVDQRKPLCSLFFHADERNSWSWAAWSPLGPFETSDESIERAIGWHFNPKQPGAPATFDDIGKYRGDFFGKGLLRILIEQGKVTDWPPTPRVKVSLQFDPESPAAELVSGGWKVRDRDLRFYVSVTAPDVDPEIVGVTLHGNEVSTPLELKRFDQARDLWTGSLRKLITEPGIIQVSATVTLNVAGRERRTENLPLGDVRLQNPAPAIVHVPPSDLDVQSETFSFRATVRSTVPATAILILNSDTPIRLPVTPHRLQEISHPLKLRSGSNQIALRIQNNAPLAGFESEETTERRFFVHVAPGEPPSIRLTRINGSPLSAKDAIVVTEPHIVVEGTISSKQPIVRAECGVLDEALRLSKPQPLWEQVASAAPAPFRIDVPVNPGEGVIEFKAASAAGESARSLRYLFHPELPSIREVDVDASCTIGVLAPPSTRFSVTLEEPAHVVNYSSHVQLDLRPAAGAKLLDETWPTRGTRKLTWKVPLHFGQNRLSVLLTNGFSSIQSDPTMIDVKPVPGRIEVTSVEPVPGRLAARFRLRFPSKAKPLAVDVSVNRQPERRTHVSFVPSPRDATLWETELEIDGLATGNNVVQLRGVAADATSQEATVQAVEIAGRQATAPPTITILSPREPVEQDSSGVPIVFTVTPKELLASAQVFLINGDREERLAAVNPRDNGNLRIVNVQLPEGPQTIRVRVFENGQLVGNPDETQVSVVTRSVRVQLASLSWKQGDWALVSRRNGQKFGPVGAAAVTAHGEIDWGDTVPIANRTHSVYVRIWVNAFLQFVDEVKPPVGDRSSFDADLTLGSATDNAIRVELIGAPQRETSAYSVDCRQPDRRQELHLLVVDCAKPMANENSDPVQQVKEAFGVRTDAHGNAASKVFARVKLYSPCVGPQVDSNRVFAALVALKLKASQPSPVNRVFLFYYRGAEFRSSDGSSFILKTRDATRSNGVSSRYLARSFNKLKGAHLVFLDVIDRERDVEGSDPWRSMPPTLGLVRSVNLRPTEKTLAAYLSEAKSQAGSTSSPAKELTLLDVANWLRKRLQNRVDHSLADSPVAMLHIIGN